MIIDFEYFRHVTPGIDEFVQHSLVVPGHAPLKQPCSQERYSLDDIVESILHYYKEGNKIIFNSECEGLVRDLIEYASTISTKLVENKIPYKDIYYVSGALPVKFNIDVYNQYCLDNNLLPLNIIINNNWEIIGRNMIMENNIEPNLSIKKRPKKFISMNGVPRIHRVYFTALLLERGLIDKSHYSINISRNFNVDDTITEKCFPNSYNKVKKIIKQYDRLFPMKLTRDFSQPFQLNIYEKDYKLFDEAYFGVVLETNFVDSTEECFNCPNTILISEKTYRNIAMCKPFITLNRPYALQNLREYGYKTFSPFIDESYDTIEDNTKRLKAVYKEVERLCNLNDNEWLTIQRELKPVVEYNYNKMKDALFYNIKNEAIS